VAAKRLERPPPKAPGRWSGGEAAGTDTGGWPEWVEARPPGGGGRIAASACGERGQDLDMDERQRRWRHSAARPSRRMPPGAQRSGQASQPTGRGSGSERPRLPEESCCTPPRRPRLPKGDCYTPPRSRGSRLVSLNPVGSPVGLRGSRGRRGVSTRARREMEAVIAVEHGTR
jgi:hypothetical protein